MVSKQSNWIVAAGTTLAVVTVLASGELHSGAAVRPQASSTVPRETLSGVMPHVVASIPGNLTPEKARPFFDSFSWQSFIALNWPAVAGQRGVADRPGLPQAFKDAFKPNPAGNYPTVVWGTWKQAYEMFDQGNKRPSPWASFESESPCPDAKPEVKLLVMGAKGGTLLEGSPNDINQAMAYPLIDQQRNYVRFEIRLNETEYNVIRGQDDQPSSWLYLSPNLEKAVPISFPASTEQSYGAIEIKAAWKTMTEKDDPKRYYVVEATIYNPDTKSCSTSKMGLVGFHIAHKTTPFAEWIWSTFEHVDNVEVGGGATPGSKPSFNNGTNMPPTPKGFDYTPKKVPPLLDAAQRTPVQVTRVNEIPTTPKGNSTVDMNERYHKLLASTVWENYELVATQWPTQPASFKVKGKYPGDCGNPFPPDLVANTVAETYFQVQTSAFFGSSCMHCHYRAAPTDFSFVLAIRAHPLVPAEPMASSVRRARALEGLDQLRVPAEGFNDSAILLRDNLRELRRLQPSAR